MYTNGVGSNLMEGGAAHRVPAEFKWKSKQLTQNSPQCEKVAYFIAYLPGGDIVDRPATEKDKLNYAREWALFEANADQLVIGWPIEKCPFLDIAQAGTYNLLGIKTMEALAEAPDTVLQQVLGGPTHRDKARAMLKAAEEGKPFLELADKNAQLESKVDLQAKQIGELCEEIEKLKKKLGEPTPAAAKK